MRRSIIGQSVHLILLSAIVATLGIVVMGSGHALAEDPKDGPCRASTPIPGADISPDEALRDCPAKVQPGRGDKDGGVEPLHTITCSIRWTWLPVPGAVYWGARTQCNYPVTFNTCEAYLYWQPEPGGGYFYIDSTGFQDYDGQDTCWATDWYNYEAPGNYLVEFCHAYWEPNHTPQHGWHCHWGLFSR